LLAKEVNRVFPFFVVQNSINIVMPANILKGTRAGIWKPWSIRYRTDISPATWTTCNRNVDKRNLSCSFSNLISPRMSHGHEPPNRLCGIVPLLIRDIATNASHYAPFTCKLSSFNSDHISWLFSDILQKVPNFF